jgi:predicted GIY-YIG superfamily endonuclease
MSTSTDRPSTSQSNSVFVLYRFYGTDDSLLYIGLTRNPAKRLEQHAGGKSWWTDVARIEFEHFSSLTELREAEREAIQTEKPAHNIRMNEASSKARPARVAAIEESAIDCLVGRFFHTFSDLDDNTSEHATIINGRVLRWQGRVLEEVSHELYTIETYSWWDGCATGHQLARIDDMLDWRFYDTSLEMQVAMPCGESHDSGITCRGEREFYSGMPGHGLHFICQRMPQTLPRIR